MTLPFPSAMMLARCPPVTTDCTSPCIMHVTQTQLQSQQFLAKCMHFFIARETHLHVAALEDTPASEQSLLSAYR